MSDAGTTDEPRAISFAGRLRQQSAQDPDRVAVVQVSATGEEHAVTLAELELECNRIAHGLREAGVSPESMVIVALPNSTHHLAATLAAWRLGACVMPLNPVLPAHERDQIVELASEWRDTLVITDEPMGRWPHRTIAQLIEHPNTEPIAGTLPHPGKAIGSGGSTGRPKIIVNPAPWAKKIGDFGSLAVTGVGGDETQLITGRLYHNTAFMAAHRGLFDGHVLVMMEKFDAELAVTLIERHRVSFMACVPTMLQRIAKLPDVAARDFSSIRAMYFTGAAAPDWMREVWATLVPLERQFDIYGAAEGIGQCVLRGDEWAAHPGTVGRPYDTDVTIRDDDVNEVAVGEVGAIYLRPRGATGAPFRYLGTPQPEPVDGGYYSVGDIGFLDAEGYVHLLDRRVDMVVTGGANVYCAEVEQALTRHPEVVDAVVIGLPDEEWGHRVHAIVELRPESALDAAGLSTYVRERLSSYKCPKTYEFVETFPRDESGKVRRSALAAERRSKGAATLSAQPAGG